MPVRSLTSSVFKRPDRAIVHAAAKAWALEQARLHPEVRRIGYFGSYARNDWGVGSDLDLVAVVGDSDQPFHRRPFQWSLDGLPVPSR